MSYDIIEIGDRVRSFDFEGTDLVGPRACYVEGTVVGTEERDCTRYIIEVSRRVFAGEERPVSVRERRVYPPVNGTPTLFGGVQTGVVRIGGAK